MSSVETLSIVGDPPIGIGPARAFLRLGTNGDDEALSRLIALAIGQFEAEHGRALGQKIIRQTESFGPNAPLPLKIRPELTPVVALIEAQLIWPNGTIEPLDIARIIFDGTHFLVPKMAAAICLSYKVGHELADEADIARCLMSLAGLYGRRSALLNNEGADVAQTPTAAPRL